MKLLYFFHKICRVIPHDIDELSSDVCPPGGLYEGRSVDTPHLVDALDRQQHPPTRLDLECCVRVNLVLVVQRSVENVPP